MTETKGRPFPRRLFAALAAGGLLAAGIFIGVMSVEGVTVGRLAEAGGFGVFGLLMLWGTYSRS
jgi:hypothetical protein